MLTGRRRVFCILFSILIFSSSYSSDPTTAASVLIRVIQYIPTIQAALPVFLKQYENGKKFFEHKASLQPVEHIKKQMTEKSTGWTNNSISEKSLGSEQAHKIPLNQPAEQFSTEIAQPKTESKLTQGSSFVIGGQDAEKQFLQPGQRQQPQDYDLKNDSGHFYNDGKGSVGYQASVGNAHVSVGTDIGSIVRFGKDLSGVVFADDDRSKTSTDKFATQEKVLQEQLKIDEQTYQTKYASQSKEQLTAKQAQLENQRSQVCQQADVVANKRTDKRYSRKAQEQAWKEHDQLDYENRRLAREINVIKEQLKHKNAIEQRVIHTAATSMIMTSQTTGTTSTSTTTMTPVEWTPKSRAIKELIESRNTPDESVDMEAWNKLLYDPSYGVAPESKSTIKTLEQTTSQITPRLATATNVSTQAPLSPPIPVSQPSSLNQVKDGATFFVQNVEFQGTMQATQGAVVAAEFLKDDGAADYFLGKPAKFALGSCILGVGGPAAISTICPPCAPFMAPALAAGMTYCKVAAVPVAATWATLDNVQHLAGGENTITKTRKKHYDNAIAKIKKPEYELSDDQYFSGLSKIPTSQLEKMKSESESWIWKAAHYSPSSIDRYQAEHEQRLGKLIGEELEIRTLRPVNEISDEENIKRLKEQNVEYIKALKQTQENFVKAGTNSGKRRDKYLASRAQHYLKHTEQELNFREKLVAHLNDLNTPNNNEKPIPTNNTSGNDSGNGSPKKDDDENKKKIIDAVKGAKTAADQIEEEAKKRGWTNPDMPALDDKQQINHIFPKNKPDHDPFSLEAYQEMQELVRDAKNFLGKDKHGNQWFSRITKDGKEKWAKAFGNKVKSGGTSNKPGFYDSELGLIKENSPAYKEFLRRERLKITKV